MNPYNKKIGTEGEVQACLWLEQKGHKVLEKNFRNKVFEIDIVSLCSKNVLHFVEVKTIDAGSVEDAAFSVYNRNIHKYFKGVDVFIDKNPEYETFSMSMDVVVVWGQQFLFYENVTSDVIL